MANIAEILKEIELHDSSLISLSAFGNGSVQLHIDLDDVWNEKLNAKPKGLLFHSVYEISEFKIDRLNIIGSVEVNPRDTYDKSFVTHCAENSNGAVEVSIELVAGGALKIICSGSAEYIFGPVRNFV